MSAPSNGHYLDYDGKYLPAEAWVILWNRLPDQDAIVYQGLQWGRLQHPTPRSDSERLAFLAAEYNQTFCLWLGPEGSAERPWLEVVPAELVGPLKQRELTLAAGPGRWFVVATSDQYRQDFQEPTLSRWRTKIPEVFRRGGRASVTDEVWNLLSCGKAQEALRIHCAQLMARAAEGAS